MTAQPFLDDQALAPPAAPDNLCHLDDGTGLHALCLAPSGSGELTCSTPGVLPVVCPDCGLRVCSRCRELGLLGLALRAGGPEPAKETSDESR